MSTRNYTHGSIEKESRIVNADIFPALPNARFFQDWISYRLRYAIYLKVFILTLYQSAEDILEVWLTIYKIRRNTYLKISLSLLNRFSNCSSTTKLDNRLAFQFIVVLIVQTLVSWIEYRQLTYLEINTCKLISSIDQELKDFSSCNSSTWINLSYLNVCMKMKKINFNRLWICV